MIEVQTLSFNSRSFVKMIIYWLRNYSNLYRQCPIFRGSKVFGQLTEKVSSVTLFFMKKEADTLSGWRDGQYLKLIQSVEFIVDSFSLYF